jgi:hypothetical protein
MTSRVIRMFFNRGVVFMPTDGRVLLAFHGEETEALDLTADLPLLLGAGLALLAKPSRDTPSRHDTASDTASDTISTARDDTAMLDVATLEFPDRMRVYHDGRRLSTDEVGAAVQETVRSAIRAAVIAYNA